MSDARNAAIDAMARAHDPVGWRWFDDQSGNANPSTQEARRIFFADQISRGDRSLDALLAILPQMGLTFPMPVEMTREMAWALDLTDCDPGPAEDPSPLLGWNAPYRAMIATAPNVLGRTDGE